MKTVFVLFESPIIDGVIDGDNSRDIFLQVFSSLDIAQKQGDKLAEKERKEYMDTGDEGYLSVFTIDEITLDNTDFLKDVLQKPLSRWQKSCFNVGENIEETPWEEVQREYE